jgi:hypothetical protein
LKKISILVFLLLIFSNCFSNTTGNNVHAEGTKTISGVISLPYGELAPSGGVKGYVFISNGSDCGYADLNIAEGQNNMSYSIAIPENATINKWKVYCILNLNKAVTYSSSSSYYGGTEYNSATLVDTSNGDAKNINITLYKNRVISGIISLPNNELAPSGGISIVIMAHGSDGSTPASLSTIPEGQNSASYSIGVFQYASVKWKIDYEISSRISIYRSSAYYGGADYSSAYPIDISYGDVNNINIMMSKNKIVTGTISLPNNELAPAGGLSLSVRFAYSDTVSYGTTYVTIPEGKNSVQYSIGIPQEMIHESLKIGYNCYSNSDVYASGGYYGGGDYNSASLIDLSTGDVKDADILLVNNIIYGDVDGDGRVTSSDYALVKRYVLHQTTQLSGENAENINIKADVNGDGKIDSLDYVLIKKYLLGEVVKFPIQK